VIHTGSHIILAAVVDRGPRPDDLEFHRVVCQAHARLPFDTLLADAGYDAEPHHEFLQQMGVAGIIPPRRGRPPKKPDHVPGGRHRQQLASDWPKEAYGQRWQVETDFSMLKRLMGSAVRSRRRHAIDREIVLRVLALNLMIIWRPPRWLFSTEQECPLFSDSHKMPHFLRFLEK
jgi:transposase